MSISILYQNNRTGDAFDITSLCTGAKWATKRAGTPASLELTTLADSNVAWAHGGILALKDDKNGLFYGYVVKVSQNEKGQVTGQWSLPEGTGCVQMETKPQS